MPKQFRSNKTYESFSIWKSDNPNIFDKIEKGDYVWFNLRWSGAYDACIAFNIVKGSYGQYVGCNKKIYFYYDYQKNNCNTSSDSSSSGYYSSEEKQDDQNFDPKQSWTTTFTSKYTNFEFYGWVTDDYKIKKMKRNNEVLKFSFSLSPEIFFFSFT